MEHEKSLRPEAPIAQSIEAKSGEDQGKIADRGPACNPAAPATVPA
jgi:hypothetical protein